MRDTSKDTEELSRLARWIHNNVPDEPSVPDESIVDTAIRLIQQADVTALPRKGSAFIPPPRE